MSVRYHLVMKYSDEMYDTKDIILLHNQIALRQGAVWIGKPYHVMGRVPMMQINEQIEAGFSSRLYLIDNKRTRPIGHFGELLFISMKSPKEERELIPLFYKEKKILSRMKVWMKVSFLQGFYLDELPELQKANKSYEQAVSFATGCSEYFMMVQDV